MSFKSCFIIIALLLFFSVNIYADEEKLLFAIDLIRHGDRTPTAKIPRQPYPWKEGLGMLTPEGREQVIRLGEQMRKIYVSQYHLLSGKYNKSDIYVRSTDTKRTIASARAFLIGFYSLSDTVWIENRAVIPIAVVSKDRDNLLQVKPSKNISSLLKVYLLSRNGWKENTHTIQVKLKLWSDATGIKLNGFKKLNILADNLYIRQVHHVTLPQGINNEDATKIISLNERAVVQNFKLKEITQPMGQAFLKRVDQYFNLAANNKTPLKYILYVGHDSSIMSVMNTLGTPLSKIPPYASHINFLLFERNKINYMRVLYNNKPVFIPACHGQICSISQFNTLINNK
ncbi:MAG: histidine-type phosphatase [Gammaproteobacteria bacterium]|nr:histidine-type phosphatase [Gammaproteobacteria bacterium]